MSITARWASPIFLLLSLGTTASADVITDWNEKAVALVAKNRMLPPQAERVMACMHVAMFDSVNSVDRRYQPYGASIAAPKDTSKETAAAVAAGAVLAQLFPNDAGEVQAALTAYIAPIPDGAPKSAGVKLGQEVAAKTIMD